MHLRVAGWRGISDLRPGDVVLVPVYPLFEPDISVYSTTTSATIPSALDLSFPVAEEKLWTSEYHHLAPSLARLRFLHRFYPNYAGLPIVIEAHRDQRQHHWSSQTRLPE